MKKKLMTGVFSALSLMFAITAYAANLTTTQKDDCFTNNTSQLGRSNCCKLACAAANTTAADKADCEKDCNDHTISG